MRRRVADLEAVGPPTAAAHDVLSTAVREREIVDEVAAQRLLEPVLH